MEIWKEVSDTDGRYEVSSLGRVKSNYKNGYKILTPSLNKKRRYYYVTIVYPSGRKNWQLHRLVAGAFIENPSKLPCVDHIDGNRANNKASNLEWVTHKENTRRGIARGSIRLMRQGENATKLDWDKVRAIRKERAENGTRYIDLADKYNVKYSTIAHIIRGSRWREQKENI